MDKDCNMAVVVVPVYRPILNQEEYLAFVQCLKVLGEYTISIVCPCSLNVNYYQSLSKEFRKNILINTFPDRYFYSVKGYNLLMLSYRFYKRFKSYSYMLIYQLDAWVFRDELDYWCDLGYDYIGAPWFENYGTHEQGNKLWAVGNGGISLRRIQYFIDLLKYDGPLKDASTLELSNSIKNRLYKYLYAKGYQNSVSYFRKDPTLFEDVFYTVYLKDTRYRANVPSVEKAALFAFEKSPSYLYTITGKLPFGCHAWLKNEYEAFWFKYIYEKENKGQ